MPKRSRTRRRTKRQPAKMRRRTVVVAVGRPFSAHAGTQCSAPKAGHIFPFVFFRMIAEGRGGPKKPRSINAFGKAWKSACRAAGCPGRIPHELRRTAVRNLVRAGIPERVAMTMTGHETRGVFERYNIVSDGDLWEAARKLDATLPSAQTGIVT